MDAFFRIRRRRAAARSRVNLHIINTYQRITSFLGILPVEHSSEMTRNHIQRSDLQSYQFQ